LSQETLTRTLKRFEIAIYDEGRGMTGSPRHLLVLIVVFLFPEKKKPSEWMSQNE